MADKFGVCPICGRLVRAPFWLRHGRGHVRQGEAVEVKLRYGRVAFRRPGFTNANSDKGEGEACGKEAAD